MTARGILDTHLQLAAMAFPSCGKPPSLRSFRHCKRSTDPLKKARFLLHWARFPHLFQTLTRLSKAMWLCQLGESLLSEGIFRPTTILLISCIPSCFPSPKTFPFWAICWEMSQVASFPHSAKYWQVSSHQKCCAVSKELSQSCTPNGYIRNILALIKSSV